MRPVRLVVVAIMFFFASGLVEAADKPALDRVLDSPLPEYPAEMLSQRVEASVTLTILLAPSGALRRVKASGDSDARFVPSCEDAVRKWTFKPALGSETGNGEVSLVRINFKNGTVTREDLKNPFRDGVRPKAVKQFTPHFPVNMIRSGRGGRVLLAFTVDTKGAVRDPIVVESTDPAFESAAIEAILQWKFKPGTVDERPVETGLVVPMLFRVEGSTVNDSFEVTRGKKSELREEVRFDKPPKPNTTVLPVFPYDDAINGDRGEAEVRFIVGSDGRVLATKVVSASKPGFGMALAAAMEEWRFEPATREGKPVMAVITRKQDFRIGGNEAVISLEVGKIASQIRRGRFSPAKPSELDNPLKPRFSAPPSYPTALKDSEVAGSAIIEIVVDKNGHAILPKVIKASAPEFGWAAATAAQRWLFDPPTSKGKPVEVVVQIPFSFTVATGSEK